MTAITAIVPTYNRAGFLLEALNSLAAQSRPVEEIIVWDDGSTDGTEDAVRACQVPVRYFRSANGGKAKALNAAMQEARGDLIWICDDDDLALPHAAEQLAALLADNPKAGCAAGSYRRFRNGTQPGERIESGPGYWPDLATGSVLRHLLEDIFLFQNATLVRKSLYDQVGPFREDLARSIDYDMIIRLALHAPIAITEDAVFLQRKHDGERGPARARHAAANSDAVWKEADKAVFAPFRDKIALSTYCAFFEGDLADRAGLLQRACVFARRTDWNAALDDFAAAAELFPESPLTPVEIAICRRAMAGKHGVSEALAATSRRRLVSMAKSGAIGAEIGRGLARGVFWRGRAALKTGHMKEAVAIFRFIAALGLPALHKVQAGSGSVLTERTDLSDEVWLAYSVPPLT